MRVSGEQHAIPQGLSPGRRRRHAGKQAATHHEERLTPGVLNGGDRNWR